MKRLLLTTFLATAFFTNTYAEDQLPIALSHPVKAWLLMDYDSGRVLAEYNGKQKLEPASITKVMTSYLIAEALSKGVIQQDALVMVSDYARAQEGSRMFVESGSSIAVRDLILGMVIQSGNDSSIALAEYLAGSEANFVQLMNKKALELGMSDTHYENVTGLPGINHVTTAYDLARLSRSMIKHYPEHYKIYSQKSFTWNKITQENRNRLLWTDPSVDGIKTGHTRSAGFNLASSALRNNFRVISIVLGANNMAQREKVSSELLNYAYQNYDHKILYKANEVIHTFPVHEGLENSVALGFNEDFGVTFPRTHYADLTAKIIIQRPLVAPIKKGTTLGYLELYDKAHNPIIKAPLKALTQVQQAGVMKKYWDQFKYKLINKYQKLKSAL